MDTTTAVYIPAPLKLGDQKSTYDFVIITPCSHLTINHPLLTVQHQLNMRVIPGAVVKPGTTEMEMEMEMETEMEMEM